jgi:hypothetical protein
MKVLPLENGLPSKPVVKFTVHLAAILFIPENTINVPYYQNRAYHLAKDYFRKVEYTSIHLTMSADYSQMNGYSGKVTFFVPVKFTEQFKKFLKCANTRAKIDADMTDIESLNRQNY